MGFPNDTTPRDSDSVAITIKKILLALTTGGESPESTVAISQLSPGVTNGVVASGADADNAPVTKNPVQTGGVAVTSGSYAPGYTAGDAAKFAVDKDNGGALSLIRLLTTADAVTNTPVASSTASTSAYAASKIAKASAGRLFSVSGYNSKALAQFIQIHDSATLPADTAVPIVILTAPATGNFSVDFGPLGIPCAAGIVLCNSSTGPTKTIGSGDCWFQATYV